MAGAVMVDFEGEGSGVAELAWGQQSMWDTTRRQNSALPLGGAMALPAGITVDDIVVLLRYAMSRHQSLRTRLRVAADGRMEQVLFSSGRIPMELVETHGADPADIADAVRVRYCLTDVDYANEWPVRVGLVIHHGQLTHLVALYCHVATDGYGLELLTSDLATRDPVTGGPTAPVVGTQPLAQARWQATADGRRHSDAAINYHERLLRGIPSQRFAGSTDERQPRHWQALYTSPALNLAIHNVAARTGLDTTPVLLASFAVGLAQVTRRSPSAAQVIVSNRFRKELAHVVSTVSQPSLCVVDVRDITFDEAVRRAWRSAMSAYKYAYYNPRDRDDLIARIDDERGDQMDLGCYFNDRRIRSRHDAVTAADTVRELNEAGERSTLRWQRAVDRSRERLSVHVNDVSDTIAIEVSADTRYVSPADMEALPRAMEAVVVRAAFDPTATTGVRADHRSEYSVEVDQPAAAAALS